MLHEAELAVVGLSVLILATVRLPASAPLNEHESAPDEVNAQSVT